MTTVYALAQLRIHDRPAYDAYVKAFAGVLVPFGGRLLVADERPRVLEGEWGFDKTVLLEFPDEERLYAWASSDAYRAIADQRRASAEGPVLLLHGVPSKVTYDRIGAGYAQKRREDPVVARAIEEALGRAKTVVNVGAGTGSYEPRDRSVVAVEPSDVMAAQRPIGAAPSIRASAQDLPFRDASFDAAMAVLTLHHWHPDQERGVRELRRVARGPVAIVTIDPRLSGDMWLMADYMVEVAALDRRIFPVPETVAGWLGDGTRVVTLPVSRDTPDGTLLSFWAHPERVLDEGARAATSGFARMPAAVVERVVADVRRDLASGAWDAKHGHLRALGECDVGLRLIVHEQRPAAGRDRVG